MAAALVRTIVVEWQDIASDYINSLPSKQKGKGINGKTWVNGITVILYKFAQDVWQERNDDRHGRDKTAHKQLLVEQASLQTEEFYKLRNAVLPRHRQLFYESYEQHKEVEETSKGLLQWISTWGPVIHQSSEQAKRLGINGVHSILRYFRRSLDG